MLNFLGGEKACMKGMALCIDRVVIMGVTIGSSGGKSREQQHLGYDFGSGFV